MKVNQMSFNLLVGTYIAVRSAGEYAHSLLDFFDEKIKVERNYKRRIEKLKTAADDVRDITDRMLKYPDVKGMSDAKVEDVETVIYECVCLDDAKLQRVLKYIKKLK